jgi:glyoxylase-like metal-dependent hydrolase (beta-lactamase superfamily II)
MNEDTSVKPDPIAKDADHRTGIVRGDENLTYPHGDDVPEGKKVIELAKGIYWARLPLPFSLDHINIYLFDEGDGWTVVDTGVNGSKSTEVWELLEQGIMGGKPIKHVVATHMHPDHLGLAGWLTRRHDAEFSITQGEFMLGQHLWNGAADVMPDEEIAFMLKAGVSRSFEPQMKAAGFGFYKKGVHELPYSYTRLEDGSIIEIGGRKWQVIVGRGHSPEHACLMCLDEPLFIAGDQILPQITSNVSVYAREPLANPLAHWLTSLDRMRGLEGKPMVFPSHGKVFYGLHERLDSLIDSHLTKLVRLHDWCKEAQKPVETFPALFRREITGFDFFMALGEALAHLHLLESIGLLERSFDGRHDRFRAVGDAAATDIIAACEALPGIPMRPLDSL